MAAITPFSVAALISLGSGAIWQMIVKRAKLLNETESTTLPPEWVKGDQNVG